MNRSLVRTGLLLCASAALSVAGCGSSNENPTNITLTRVGPASASCASGGVSISSGVDANGNGVLDDAEVASTQDVCNGTSTPGMTGASGYGALVSTSMLPVGDTNCVGGGTRIDTGVDDGKNGGVAGDGILQMGEITATQYVCNGRQPFFPGVTTASGTVGTGKIDTSGGNGTTGVGGGGGYVYLEMGYGTLGGHVKVFNTGTVDTRFDVPTITPNLGAVPLQVDADTTIMSYATANDGITAGNTFFAVNNISRLYKNVSGVATEVTGISIAAGKTLTLPNTYGSYANLTLINDFVNAGTFKMALQADAKTAGSIYLHCSSYLGQTGSKVDLDGLAATGSVGGSAGTFEVTYGAHFINQGTLTANGGAGDSGGYGGTIYPHSDSGDLYNTGPISATGGVGSVAGGGGGGTIELASGYRSTYNSAPLDTHGGAGVTGGGSGGDIYFWINDVGSAINGGAINAKGGACSATDCTGGSGGDFNFGDYVYGGDSLNSGAIDLSGADGKGTGTGGSGGDFTIYNYDDDYNYAGNQYQPTGSVRVSGDIVLKAGNGAIGGHGGSVYVYLETYYTQLGQEIAFYGYTDIKTKGGDSTSSTGGAGGYVQLDQDNPARIGGESRVRGPAGAAINYANIDTRGGNGANGGNGGYVDMSTQTQYNAYNNNPYEFVANYGSINTSGGDSTAASGTAGTAGYISLVGITGVTNNGAITMSGGSATGDNSFGGYSNELTLSSDFAPAKNTMPIVANGGSGGATGGTGRGAGAVYIYGNTANNSAAITANGGGAGTNGGNGGYIELFSSPNGPSTNTGTLSVSPGAATNMGAKGEVFIDGGNATP